MEAGLGQAHKPPPEDEDDKFFHQFALSVEDMIACRLAPHYRYTSYRFFRSPVIDLFEILQKRGGLHGPYKPPYPHR
jgi:hypothetical protein